MMNSLKVKVLYPARWRRRIREAQGRRREAGSEGSVDQTCDLMNKNRIRGLPLPVDFINHLTLVKVFCTLVIWNPPSPPYYPVCAPLFLA